MSMTRSFFILALILSVFGTAVPAYAATATAPYHYQRLFYYTEGDLAKASFKAHASSIDIFAPQTYKIVADGTINGTVDQELLDFAKAHKVKVMPLVTNGGFSREASKAFLGDAAKENIAINALIAEARDHGYWGYQFDFEQMDATDKDLYTNFVRLAYASFKMHGLSLSVAVIAKTSDNPSDYAPGLWQNLIGVYDYTALAQNADFLSIMSYDDPTSKQGPAPWPWYQKVFTYTLATVPNNKISMGIPVYYWQWQDSTGKLVGIGGNEGIDNVFAKYRPKVSWDASVGEPMLSYNGLGGVKYTLWYENAQSIKPKVGLVTTNHLYGVSFWTLGLELPSVYSVIKE